MTIKKTGGWFAVVDVNGIGRVPVMPRSKKTTRFATREDAVRAAEKFGRNLDVNARGYIWEAGTDKANAYTIAL